MIAWSPRKRQSLSVSYDLSFWSQKAELGIEPAEIQTRLLDGVRIDDVADLPIEDMRGKTAAAFSDWARVDEDMWERDGNGAAPAFQLFTTPQFFHVTCYGLEGEDMNRFIDVAAEFGCPLFDPQTGERFG